MGCDIHGFTEVKIKEQWHAYSALNIDRHYALFGRLAGVRSNEHEPIVEPRGLPENISIVTDWQYREWDSDAHTTSWLTHKEMAEIQEYAENKLGYKCYERIFGYLDGNDWDELPDGIEDARVIFWFDN